MRRLSPGQPAHGRANRSFDTRPQQVGPKRHAGLSHEQMPKPARREAGDTGVPARDANRPDRGRAAALTKVQQDEFNCLGLYMPSRRNAKNCASWRRRTPAWRAPYMRAGQLASLDDVVRHYVEAPAAAAGHSEFSHSRQAPGGARRSHDAQQPIALSPAEQRDLVAFLRTLSAAASSPGSTTGGGGKPAGSQAGFGKHAIKIVATRARRYWARGLFLLLI